MTAAPPIIGSGLPLEELAARLGVSAEQAEQIIGPLLAAGLIAERGGALTIADLEVAHAFGAGPP